MYCLFGQAVTDQVDYLNDPAGTPAHCFINSYINYAVNSDTKI